MKDKKALITEAEIQQALKKFQAKGGLIKKLPDEVVPAHNLVGNKWAMYENILEGNGSGAPAAEAN